MRISEALLRFILGGGLILFISLLGQTRYRLLSGLFVLFPAVTLIGFYFLSLEVTQSQLQDTILFSILATPTVIAFLGCFYISLYRYSTIQSLGLGLIGWSIAALFIYEFNNKFVGL